MLNNLIQILIINTPKVQETNKKASVNTNSNSFRDMFMAFQLSSTKCARNSASQHYKPVWFSD